MKKGIECPHCGEFLSKEYAVKSLAILAKADGYDFDDELQALAEGDSEEGHMDEEDAPLDGETEKGGRRRRKRSGGGSGPTNYVGNKTQSHRGQAPGSMHSSSRAQSGEPVQRTQRPTSPTTEQGMKKSLRLPIIEGEPQVVEYSMGLDSFVAKGIENDTLHIPPARNLRAEQELSAAETSEE